MSKVLYRVEITKDPFDSPEFQKFLDQIGSHNWMLLQVLPFNKVMNRTVSITDKPILQTYICFIFYKIEHDT